MAGKSDSERDQLIGRLTAALTTVKTSLGFRHSELTHLGIGQGGFMVLNYLESHGPSKMSETAAALGVTSASITGITGNLVRDGLIRRLAAPHDRRVVMVENTELGRQKLNEVEQLQHRRALAALTSVGDADLSELVRTVERLAVTASGADRMEQRTRNVEGNS